MASCSEGGRGGGRFEFFDFFFGKMGEEGGRADLEAGER